MQTPSRFSMTLTPGGLPALVPSADGKTWVAKGLKMFRAGTWTDMTGSTNTWSVADLHSIAAHFSMLRESNVFPNVPVRRDHSRDIDSVMGYVIAMYVKGDFLLGDIEITDAEAAVKYASGTYRARSFEVGPMRHGEKILNPVGWGLAFVDIPAVPGLYSQSTGEALAEYTLSEDNKMHKFTINGVPTEDVAAVEAHIAKLEAQIAAPVAPHKFAVAGVDVDDYAVVQSHIATLEAFQAEAVVEGRKAYVAKLATDRKITSAQVEGLQALAVSLPAEGYKQFTASYDAMPELPLLQKHAAGEGQGGEGGDSGKGDAKTERIAELEGVVAMHRNTGKSQDEIAKLASWVELQSLKSA